MRSGGEVVQGARTISHTTFSSCKQALLFPSRSHDLFLFFLFALPGFSLHMRRGVHGVSSLRASSIDHITICARTLSCGTGQCNAVLDWSRLEAIEVATIQSHSMEQGSKMQSDGGYYSRLVAFSVSWSPENGRKDKTKS